MSARKSGHGTPTYGGNDGNPKILQAKGSKRSQGLRKDARNLAKGKPLQNIKLNKAGFVTSDDESSNTFTGGIVVPPALQAPHVRKNPIQSVTSSNQDSGSRPLSLHTSGPQPSEPTSQLDGFPTGSNSDGVESPSYNYDSDLGEAEPYFSKVFNESDFTSILSNEDLKDVQSCRKLMEQFPRMVAKVMCSVIQSEAFSDRMAAIIANVVGPRKALDRQDTVHSEDPNFIPHDFVTVEVDGISETWTITRAQAASLSRITELRPQVRAMLLMLFHEDVKALKLMWLQRPPSDVAGAVRLSSLHRQWLHAGVMKLNKSILAQKMAIEKCPDGEVKDLTKFTLKTLMDKSMADTDKAITRVLDYFRSDVNDEGQYEGHAKKNRSGATRVKKPRHDLETSSDSSFQTNPEDDDF